MRDIPRYFREQMAEMRRGLRRGFTPPRVTIAGRDASITAVTEAAAGGEPVLHPLQGHAGGAGGRSERLCAREAISIIRETVQPAYRELLAFMRTEYLPGHAHLSRRLRPAGREGLLSSEDPRVHDARSRPGSHPRVRRIGSRPPARANARGHERDADSRAISPRSSQFLRADPQFQAKTPEELLMRAAWIAKRFDGKASQYFGLLPRARFAIQPVPEDLAPFYTAGRGGPGLYLAQHL